MKKPAFSIAPTRVFVSATSADLRSVRQIVKEALLTLNCHPVEQTNFPPDYRSVREMLREKIESCDAVIHIVGNRFGEEPDPSKLPPGQPRRSYTQMEHDLARELGKKLYVFLCPPGFPFDAEPNEESEEKRALQEEHRKTISSSDQLRTDVQTPEDMALRVRELQFEVNKIQQWLRMFQRHVVTGVAIIVLVLLLIGGGLYMAVRDLKPPGPTPIVPRKVAADDIRAEIWMPIDTTHDGTIRFIGQGELEGVFNSAPPEMDYKIGDGEWKHSMTPGMIMLNEVFSADLEDLEYADSISLRLKLRNVRAGTDPNVGPFDIKFDYRAAVAEIYKKRALAKRHWLEREDGAWRFDYFKSIFPGVKEIRLGVRAGDLNTVVFFEEQPSLFDMKAINEGHAHLSRPDADVLPKALRKAPTLYVQLEFLDGTTSDVRQFGSGEAAGISVPPSRIPISLKEKERNYEAGFWDRRGLSKSQPRMLDNGMLSPFGVFTGLDNAKHVHMGREERNFNRTVDFLRPGEGLDRVDPNFFRRANPHNNLPSLPVPLETGTLFLQPEYEDGSRGEISAIKVENPGIRSARLDSVDGGGETAPELHVAWDHTHNAVVFIPFSPNKTVRVEFALDDRPYLNPNWGGTVWGGHGFTIGRWDWAKTISLRFTMEDGTTRGPFRYALAGARELLK